MYENYPFWFTMFTKLGFSVQAVACVQQGACMKGVWRLFHPIQRAIRPSWCTGISSGWWTMVRSGYSIRASITRELRIRTAPNHYNCPIVATYPEVIAGNMDDIFEDNEVIFTHPFLPYDNDEFLVQRALQGAGAHRRHQDWNWLRTL